MRLRNLLVGLPENAGFEDMSRYVSWPCVIQYRRGGDYLAAHRDDYLYQMLLILSEIGSDFETGGNYLLDSHKHVYNEPALKFGDLVMLRSDIVHGVHPIDPHLSVDEQSERGRWILFFPLSDASLLKDEPAAIIHTPVGAQAS